jgi:hypothetical protein
MPKSAFNSARLHKYRVTLTIKAEDLEFNPHSVHWRSALNLEPAERVKFDIEELDDIGSKFRITLNMSVLEEDFDPFYINWHSALNLNQDSECHSYIEDLDSFTFWKN